MAERNNIQKIAGRVAKAGLVAAVAGLVTPEEYPVVVGGCFAFGAALSLTAGGIMSYDSHRRYIQTKNNVSNYQI